MFSRTLLLSLLSLIVVGAAMVFSLFRVGDSDRESYRLLMTAFDEDSPQDSTKKTEQRRSHVHKQLLMVDEKVRSENHLHSDRSEIVLEEGDHRSEIIERFTGLTCLFQEEVAPDSPSQIIRVFEADRAIYRYRSGELNADSVKLARYKIPGRKYQKPDESTPPFMTGMAQNVEVSLNGPSKFKAKGLKMKGGAL